MDLIYLRCVTVKMDKEIRHKLVQISKNLNGNHSRSIKELEAIKDDIDEMIGNLKESKARKQKTMKMKFWSMVAFIGIFILLVTAAINYNVNGENRFVVTMEGATVIGNLTQTTGDSILNNIYGEMGINDASLAVVIISSGVFENVTGLSNINEQNGFILQDNFTLVTQFNGLYKVVYSVSYGSDLPNRNWANVVGVNGVTIDKTKSERKISASNDMGYQGGNGNIRLEVGDEVTLMMSNLDTSSDAIINNANLNILRIAN